MTAVLGVVGLAAVSFVSTSLDNFTILLGFLADDEYPRRQVHAGYLSSVVGVVALAYLAAQAVELMPARLLGYLGLVPLSMGLLGVYRLIRSGGPAAVEATATRGKGFLAVALMMLANSGDSLGVFVSVFADTADGLEIPVVLTFCACGLAYAAVARWLVTRSRLAPPVQRASRVVLPFLLIAVGTYILMNTGTDVVR